jgi:hypothetical protein
MKCLSVVASHQPGLEAQSSMHAYLCQSWTNRAFRRRIAPIEADQGHDPPSPNRVNDKAAMSVNQTSDNLAKSQRSHRFTASRNDSISS